MNQTKEAIRFGPHLRYLEMEVNGMQEHEDLTDVSDRIKEEPLQSAATIKTLMNSCSIRSRDHTNILNRIKNTAIAYIKWV